MCGRYNLLSDADALIDFFDLSMRPQIQPAYNIAPSMQIPVVRLLDKRRVLSMLHWGLVPHWARDRKMSYRMINARAESVHQKPAFRSAFRQRRCLIPATGFYEWKQQADGKQPYNFRVGEGRLFAFAGLWESWQQADGQTLESTSIIVTAANKQVLQVHDRMPVILHPDSYADWLDPGQQDTDSLRSLLVPCPAHWLNSYPVSKAVGSPSFDGPECLKPVPQG